MVSPNSPASTSQASPCETKYHGGALPRTTCSPTVREGQRKEAEVTRKAPSEEPTHGDVGQGFVYERVPHVTLKSIANNAEIGVIWERWQETLEPLRAEMNAVLARAWEEWEIPREAGEPWPRAPRTPGRR